MGARAASSAGLLVSVAVFLAGCDGDAGWDAAIEGRRRPAAEVAADAARQRGARQSLLGPGREAVPRHERVILFGDLHVHTSYSWDGFLRGIPLAAGEGAHPPNDACDFARHCANLDFYALTDHAESMLPENWLASKASIRQCNALAGDRESPDLVAFMGFEWSQAGTTPEDHWGHRCVIFREDADERLPARPIGAADRTERWTRMGALLRRARWLQPWGWRGNTHYTEFLARLSAREPCPEGVDVRDLPPECMELAPTPRDLHEKLDQWGFAALTIPHGTTWGNYTPATATIDKHLDPLHYDAERMRLIEVYSGHGNSEDYRSWREFDVAEDGEASCPEPTVDFLPCCWQAGEIMRSRCGDLAEEDCERRVALARERAMQAYTRPMQIFPDSRPEDWLDCDQCRDCFKPALSLRPRESVQYAMAISREDEISGKPVRFRYGFVGSSDNHSGRPGTGYKQVNPTQQSDVAGSLPFPANRFAGRPSAMEDPRTPLEPARQDLGVLGADQRTTSFLYPGGLAAVHADGRSRDAIWAALQRRETYATSGPRILLWFDLLNGPEGRAPMGSEHALAESPRFEVRAVGSLEPLPGCPESSRGALSPQRLERLCGGECYHPSDRRRKVAAIEVVRIRPRVTPDETVDALIEDPWRRFACPPDPAGCVVSFEDSDFPKSGREALYYVRALEEPSDALNGRPLSTEFDERGQAVATTLCIGERVDAGGCKAPVQERAWSSPIFIAPGPAEQATAVEAAD